MSTTEVVVVVCTLAVPFPPNSPGGPLAITDANLILGRLIPDYFPKIFGPNEDQPLDLKASELAFDVLTEEVNVCGCVSVFICVCTCMCVLMCVVVCLCLYAYVLVCVLMCVVVCLCLYAYVLVYVY